MRADIGGEEFIARADEDHVRLHELALAPAIEKRALWVKYQYLGHRLANEQIDAVLCIAGDSRDQTEFRDAARSAAPALVDFVRI